MKKLLPFILLLFVSCVQPVKTMPEKPPVVVIPTEDIDMSQNIAPLASGVSQLTLVPAGATALPANVGVLGYINDENVATQHGLNYTSLGYYSYVTSIWALSFSTKMWVTTISIRYTLASISGGTYFPTRCSSYVVLNGSENLGDVLPGLSNGSIGYNTVTLDINDYVENVRIGLNTALLGATNDCKILLAEVVITGDARVSSGIRLQQGSGVVELVRETVLSSPLRYKDADGNVYSLVLVSTDDPTASTLRIRTSSGTKAVAKI